MIWRPLRNPMNRTLI